MALKADTVDLLAVRLHQLYDAGGAESLGGRVAVLEVVIVIVQLGLRVGGGSEAEGDW